MSIFASEDNLAIVRNAILELVQGKRKIKVSYADLSGRKTEHQYTEVNLNELRSLEAAMIAELKPTPIMESVDVEILF